MKRTVQRTATGTAALVLLLCCLAPGRAAADGSTADPAAPPSEAPPVRVDPHAPGLRLAPGATLAPPKVLDIVSVVADSNGDESRADTTGDVTFNLQAEVLFGMDSAVITPDANGRIQAIADEISRQNPSVVRVFGFTDNLGTHQSGVVLSTARAHAVYTLLAQDLGGDAAIRFDVRGYAEQYPIADNSTEAGRRQNRRVEISFAKSTGG